MSREIVACVRLEAALMQPAPQRFLAGQRLAVDQFEECGSACGLSCKEGMRLYIDFC